MHFLHGLSRTPSPTTSSRTSYHSRQLSLSLTRSVAPPFQIKPTALGFDLAYKPQHRRGGACPSRENLQNIGKGKPFPCGRKRKIQHHMQGTLSSAFRRRLLNSVPPRQPPFFTQKTPAEGKTFRRVSLFVLIYQSSALPVSISYACRYFAMVLWTIS